MTGIFKFLRNDKRDISNAPEFIICGLGNPGLKYENTRHNCGFMAVDRLAEEFHVKLKRLKFKSLTDIVTIGGRRCFLMKPTTFMNLSGEAVRDAMSFYKIPPENTLVIYDDINGDVGNIKIKRRGSDGGHNGIKNIIYLTGHDCFPRIKIGIGGKPHPDYPLSDWVTSPFKKSEAEALSGSLGKAVAAAKLIICGEMDKAMNEFNRNS